MTRARPAPERDLHERFTAWLLHGAADEPARDLALHGAFCPDCGAHMAALDLLPLIDSGRAPMPPSRRGAAPVIRAPFRPRLAWAAAAGLVIVAAGGWALGSGRLPLGPEASPAQQVLGGFGGGELSSATPNSPDSPGESVAASPSGASSESSTAEPAASVAGSEDPGSFAPSATNPGPTRRPRATSTATATSSPTATATPTAVAIPLPECSDGIDNDEDGRVDWGLDPAVNDPECLGPGDDSEETL